MRTEPRPVTSRSAAQHDRWRPWRTRIIQGVFRVVVDATGIPVHLGHPNGQIEPNIPPLTVVLG